MQNQPRNTGKSFQKTTVSWKQNQKPRKGCFVCKILYALRKWRHFKGMQREHCPTMLLPDWPSHKTDCSAPSCHCHHLQAASQASLVFQDTTQSMEWCENVAQKKILWYETCINKSVICLKRKIKKPVIQSNKHWIRFLQQDQRKLI